MQPMHFRTLPLTMPLDMLCWYLTCKIHNGVKFLFSYTNYFYNFWEHLASFFVWGNFSTFIWNVKEVENNPLFSFPKTSNERSWIDHQYSTNVLTEKSSSNLEKIQFIKLDVSIARIVKIKCRWRGGLAMLLIAFIMLWQEINHDWLRIVALKGFK